MKDIFGSYSNSKMFQVSTVENGKIAVDVIK